MDVIGKRTYVNILGGREDVGQPVKPLSFSDISPQGAFIGPELVIGNPRVADCGSEKAMSLEEHTAQELLKAVKVTMIMPEC